MSNSLENKNRVCICNIFACILMLLLFVVQCIPFWSVVLPKDVSQDRVSSVAMVPLREFMEKQGAEVIWHEDGRIIDVIKDNKTVTLQIESKIMKTATREKELDFAPIIFKEDKTYMPINALCEEFDITTQNGSEYEDSIYYPTTSEDFYSKTASIQGYTWFPLDNIEITENIADTLQKEDFRVEEVIFMPIIVVLSAIISAVLCIKFKDKYATLLISIFCGIVGIVCYTVQPVFRLGMGWIPHLIICIAIVITGITPSVLKLMDKIRKK